MPQFSQLYKQAVVINLRSPPHPHGEGKGCSVGRGSRPALKPSAVVQSLGNLDRTWDFSGLRSPVYLANDNTTNMYAWVRWDRNGKAFRKCPLFMLWLKAASSMGQGEFS